MRYIGSFLVFVLLASPAAAQDISASLKAALWNPTTYAPAAVFFHAATLDWDSSQRLFRHGWLEVNPRYTVDGRSPGIPVSYRAGQIRITVETAQNLGLSYANNVLSGYLSRRLIHRYPDHRRLIRAFTWIEQAAVASLIMHIAARPHYQQWRYNERVQATWIPSSAR